MVWVFGVVGVVAILSTMVADGATLIILSEAVC